MKKLIILIFIAIIHNSCQDGPQARYNEDFEEFDRYKELSFSKLIGKYELDKDSKTRYNLPDSLELYVNLKIDKKVSPRRTPYCVN